MSADFSDAKPTFSVGEEAVSPSSGLSAGPVDSEGERRVRRAIENAAPKNSSLLNDIKDTEEAVSTLQANELRLEHAKDELKDQNRAVNRATIASKNEFSNYTHRKDSRSTRWAYILTRMRNNYERKLKDAETGYHKALTEQSQAEKRQHELQRDIQAIEEEDATLQKLAEKHVAAHKEIDKLYASIFTGITPGFPDEDEREQKFIAAEAEHKATSTTVQEMARAHKNAESIKIAIDRAKSEITRAEYETDSVFFIADYILLFVEKAARFIGRAIQLQTETIVALPKPLDRQMTAVQENMKKHLDTTRPHLTALLQAQFPSRTFVYDIVQKTSYELKHLIEAQAEMAKLTRRYESTAREALKITSRALEDARQALQEIRQGAFEIIVGFGAAAPAYNECCDRAAWYEGEVHAECERIPVPTIDDANLPPLPSYEEVVS